MTNLSTYPQGIPAVDYWQDLLDSPNPKKADSGIYSLDDDELTKFLYEIHNHNRVSL